MEDEDRKWTVYIHTNKINKKRYVGITSQKPERRWRKGNGYEKGQSIYYAIRKYGWDGFEHTIFSNNLSEEEAKRLEILLIQVLRTRDKKFGYNISKGGDGRLGVEPVNKIHVCQFTVDGDYVGEFKSLTEAAKIMGSNTTSAIVNACKGKHFSAFGYCWRYKSDCNDLNKIKQEILKQQDDIHNHRVLLSRSFGEKVCQLNEDGRLIKTYDSVGYVADEFGVKPLSISTACHNGYVVQGYRWMYKSDYEKIKNGEMEFIKPDSYSGSIFQFDMNGNLIKKYKNIDEAVAENNFRYERIISACRLHKESYGSLWRYEDDYKYGEQIHIPGTITRIPVIQFTLNGDYIARYESMHDAERETASPRHSISLVCRGFNKTSKGSIWRYETDCLKQEDGTYIMPDPAEEVSA